MNESALLDLPSVECRGSPRELGRAQGAAFAPKIRAFVEQRLLALRVYLSERGEARRFAEFETLGKACSEAFARFDPEGAEEHWGIAEAAGLDPGLLYAATNMTDVRDILVLPALADREGCTSVLLPPALTRERIVIAGQTWDLNPTDLEFVIAVHRRPSQGPETWAITCTGALSLVGMNADGVAVGTTNIKTRASRVGVGYLGVLHRAIRARTRNEARELIRSAPRAAAHTYWIADAFGASELECDPETVSEQNLELEPVVQTNHCRAPELAAREGEAASSSSLRRWSRASETLALGAQDIESVRRLFADRSDGLDSVNRYAEDDQGTTTNACIICVPERRELWACRGSSDRGRWQELKFAAPLGTPAS